MFWTSHFRSKCILGMQNVQCHFVSNKASFSLVYTSCRSQQLSQRARLQWLIGNFSIILQWTATFTGHSRFAAILSKPQLSYMIPVKWNTHPLPFTKRLHLFDKEKSSFWFKAFLRINSLQRDISLARQKRNVTSHKTSIETFHLMRKSNCVQYSFGQ